MANQLITTAGLQKIADGLIPISEQVRTLVIKTPDDLQRAANIRGSIKDFVKRVNAWFKPLEDNAKQQVKEIKDKKTMALENTDPLIEKIDARVKDFTDEEDHKISMARAKAEDELRKAETERKRKADELNAKEFAARQEAQVKSDKLKEQGKLAQAQAVLDAGEKKIEALQEKAFEILTTPAVSKTVIPEKTKVANMHFRENWTAEVTDLNLVPDAYWMVDMQILNRIAREEKNLASIPGVRFNCEKTPVNSTRGGF